MFESSVLNAGSDQSLFEQLQSQAVNTGNKLQTPLIPPPRSTLLKVDELKDTVLGIVYGATIGASLGLLTDRMTPDEAEFHYVRKTVDQTHLLRDEWRCEASVGQVSPTVHIALIMLDSVTKWAGVVDELDFNKRLSSWLINIEHYIRSSPSFMESESTDSKVENIIPSHICLPAMIGVALTQFHDLSEVQQNARYFYN